MTQAQMRIGQGWDVHALVPGRRLIIGGVHIPYHLGLLGHSDADVLLHAIIDAMLGAAGLGDIGTHFRTRMYAGKMQTRWCCWPHARPYSKKKAGAYKTWTAR